VIAVNVDRALHTSMLRLQRNDNDPRSQEGGRLEAFTPIGTPVPSGLCRRRDLHSVGDVEVAYRDAYKFGEADSSVVEEPRDRGVAAVLEPLPVARAISLRMSSSCRTSGGLSGTRGGFTWRMGLRPSGISPSSSRHAKN
jgi:hypothetical protein